MISHINSIEIIRIIGVGRGAVGAALAAPIFWLVAVVFFFKNKNVLWQNMHKINNLCFFHQQSDIAIYFNICRPNIEMLPTPLRIQLLSFWLLLLSDGCNYNMDMTTRLSFFSDLFLWMFLCVGGDHVRVSLFLFKVVQPKITMYM